MKTYARRVLSGTAAEANIPPEFVEGPLGFLTGSCNGRTYRLSVDQITKYHSLYLGDARSGKSNCMKLVFKKILPAMGKDDLAVIFDSRGDYLDSFYNPARRDIVLSTLDRHKSITSRWNVFSEIMAMTGNNPSSRADNIREICEYLIPESKASNHKFFYDTSRDILRGVITRMLDQLTAPDIGEIYPLNNKALRDLLCRPITAKRHPLLHFPPGSEFEYLNEFYNKYNTWKAARDVFSFLRQIVSNLFFGTAFGSSGDFSIIKFLEDRGRGGRVLFIEYDLAHGRSLDSVYSLLIDIGLKHLMSNNEHHAVTYMGLDEIQLIESKDLNIACNFGGGSNIKILAGTQSLSGLYNKYGENTANAMIAGFSSCLCFYSSNAATRDWIKMKHGNNFIERIVTAGYSFQRKQETDYTVNDTTLDSLHVGQAIVSLPEHSPGITGRISCPPFVFQFEKFSR